jgi:hypothetical protein
MPYCMTAHTTAVNSMPAAITAERAPGSSCAPSAITVPTATAIIMCTTRPMIVAAALNVPSSGADRQKVCPIRFSGVQNPAPVYHSTIIDQIAITMPPSIPPATPARTVAGFTSGLPRTGALARPNRKPAGTAGRIVSTTTICGRSLVPLARAGGAWHRCDAGRDRRRLAQLLAEAGASHGQP